MSKYGTHVSNYASTTTFKTGILLWPKTNRRAEIVELIMTGSGAAAVADIPVQAACKYCTTGATGVGTTTTAQQFAQGSAAANSCTTTAFTQEPTAYQAVFPVFFGFNTRGGQRWSVPQGEGVKGDSGVTNNRIGFGPIAQSGTPGVDIDMLFWED